MTTDQVGRMMQHAVADGVFPGAVLLFSAGGDILFHRCYGVTDLSTRRPAGLDTVFDLASLTKPLATTLAVMALVEKGKLDCHRPLGTTLPAFAATDKSGVTIAQLLRHTSGLPDYRPYYKGVSRLPASRRRTAFEDLLVKEPLVCPPGVKTCYSDLGFMVLAQVVERIAGERLDRFVTREIYGPLGLDDLFFIDLAGPVPGRDFAATEQCPWRKKLILGEVHDDNAWAAGGIHGHAGLFGTAADVHRLAAELLGAYNGTSAHCLFPRARVRFFLDREDGRDRALGFDAPSAANASSGRYFSRNSVGHLGFTGTSFWMDLDRDIIVVLLTNRVHPSRDNTRIKDFRPKLHDGVMAYIRALGYFA